MIADDGMLATDPDCPACGTRTRSCDRWWRCGGCGLVVLMVGEAIPQLGVEVGTIHRDPVTHVGPFHDAGRIGLVSDHGRRV